MRHFALFVIIGLSLIHCNVIAQDTKIDCSDTAKMLDHVFHIASWQDLYDSFKLYRHCDDGAFAEGYSDFVVRTLASKWLTLNDLHLLTSKDSDFRSFVLQHIDDTTDSDDLKAILKNVKTNCPEGFKSLCSDIFREAETALSSISELNATSEQTDNKHHWPMTVKEAVDILLADMSEEDRQNIKNTKRQDLIKLHFGWGTELRNRLGLWAGNRELIKDTKTSHPDDASMVMIEAVWERLQKQK